MFKKDLSFRFIAIIIFTLFSCSEESVKHRDDVRTYRRTVYKLFSNVNTSPIPADEIKHFQGLNFFDIDIQYKFEAQFISHEGTDKYNMIRSKGDTIIYDIAGTLSLSNEHFKSELLLFATEDSNEYFLPFFDLSNGEETYAGGRYIDVDMNGNTIEIDFNKAYNPYCSYNKNYTCPIPPFQNLINYKILAGEKSYNH